MKKLYVVLVIVGGLLWAKKHFSDKPAEVRTPTKAEVIAEQLGKAAAHGLKVRSAVETTGTDTAAAATLTGTVDEKDAAGLLAQIQNMLHKQGSGSAGTPEDKAKARVEKFMASWKEGGTSLNDAAQAAACLWSRGVPFIPSKDEIEDAANGFDRWRKEKDLFVEIESYSVGEATHRQDMQRGDYTEVDVMINRATYRLGVPDKANPIFWTF